MAKVTTERCPCEQKYVTACRGAASPRSASPMGPAPTRDPRIAFPPPATVGDPFACSVDASFCGPWPPQAGWSDVGVAWLLVGEKQPERDDAGEPDHADAEGDPVEV